MKKVLSLFLFLNLGLFICPQEKENWVLKHRNSILPEEEEGITDTGDGENSAILDSSQEKENWDIDSMFQDLPEGEKGITDANDEENSAILDSLRDKVVLEASYDFLGGFAPGWSKAPWHGGDKKYSYVLGASMEALLSMDFRLSESLRVWNSFSFSIPDKTVFSIKEFYFDYNMQRKFFVRAGLYEVAWGISRNYPYTNLPARVPTGSGGGESYLAKLDIPIGIGGLQLLGLTRYDYMADAASPSFNEIAYGIKYNLAFPGADIDVGTFYFHEMPLRFFVSVKTTLGNTELYAEGLAATPYETWNVLQMSGSAGFIQDFFRGKLSVNGEAFYNGESDGEWWRPKTDVKEAGTNPFIHGLNTAVNLIYRPGVLGMRIFCQFLYGIEEETAQLVPGMSIKPGDLVTVTLSVPMALGSPDGTYYRSNADKNNRPFSIMLGVSFSGSFRYSIL